MAKFKNGISYERQSNEMYNYYSNAETRVHTNKHYQSQYIEQMNDIGYLPDFEIVPNKAPSRQDHMLGKISNYAPPKQYNKFGFSGKSETSSTYSKTPKKSRRSDKNNDRKTYQYKIKQQNHEVKSTYPTTNIPPTQNFTPKNNGYGHFGFRYGRNHTPLLANDENRAAGYTPLSQTLIEPESAYKSCSYSKTAKNRKESKPSYAQRKESVSSKSSRTNNSSYFEKSRIPVPNAVKKIVKNKEVKDMKPKLKKHKTQQNGLFPTEGVDVFEYDSFDEKSATKRMNTKDSEPMELVPTFIETLSDDTYTDFDSQANLIVNLEDLVNEEYYINHMATSIKLGGKQSIPNLCKQWWKVTEKSSVKDMQIFFEEELSKKLIKTQQTLLCLIVGYLQSTDLESFLEAKTKTALTNIILNLHRNYLVFVEFICNNLTDEQYDAANDWAGKLKKVLKIRPVMKSHYDVNNSELLKTNNSISIKLIKDLLGANKEGNYFTKEANFILKNIDLVEISMVRDLVTASVNKTLQLSFESTKATKKSKKYKKNAITKPAKVTQNHPAKNNSPRSNMN